MSRMFKCDRCGEVYEAYLVRPNEPAYAKQSCTYAVGKDVTSLEGFTHSEGDRSHLCRECSKAFDEWMEGGGRNG